MKKALRLGVTLLFVSALIVGAGQQVAGFEPHPPELAPTNNVAGFEPHPPELAPRV